MIDKIRNFSIIAHIDHGKSTLADRFIEFCGGLETREMNSQVLDSMDIEKERGITIKAQTASLQYKAKDGQIYNLNLIDTPGHVDFSYEVSRALSACEGAILVVDATQGVEAQTVANCYTAIDLGVEVLPILNKIDLPSAEPERVCVEIEEMIGLDSSNILCCSAKTGQGIIEIMELIVNKIPSPKGDIKKPLKAMIIDSWFDNYVGVVVLIRVVDGFLKIKDNIMFMSNRSSFICERIGIFTPKTIPKDALNAGEVGFVIAGIKNLEDAKVGDTITLNDNPATKSLPGFKEIQPKVFAGIYPIDMKEYDLLRESLAKLKLNDASLQYEQETSQALGFGFRCGFLGLLHMDIVQERLEREFNLNLIITAPTVIYQIVEYGGKTYQIDSPAKLNDFNKIKEICEPIIDANIIIPDKYLGSIIILCNKIRGVQTNLQYIGTQVILNYDLPLNEVVTNFFDQLKSISKGYASFDYVIRDFKPANLVKLDILVNGEKVDALSIIVHHDHAYNKGRELVTKLCELIPRQMFNISIQAAIGGRIIARETIGALRKNVLSKCYGGDITRKKKLLEKQKAGKRRMKLVGNVEIPQTAFLAVLKLDK